MKGRVLSIAGSDSGGGAGIQADVKTVAALGGYAATAITALTAQNTLGVTAIHPVPPDFVARQIAAVLSDIGADCVKTGMLGGPEVVEAVAAALETLAPDIPLVVDPVMTAKGGALLLADDATRVLVRRLLPRALLVTPNVPEAETLLGRAIAGPGAMAEAARALLDLGCRAVLLKGGHMDGDQVVDWLATADGTTGLADTRLPGPAPHGTGCTLASAIATGIAQGMTLADAVVRARAYLRRAIATRPQIGHGHGPLNHSA